MLGLPQPRKGLDSETADSLQELMHGPAILQREQLY
jgi:hypothetical protein